MDRDRLREAIEWWDRGEFGAISLNEQRFMDGTWLKDIVAAARAVLNATEIQWCATHETSLFNPCGPNCDQETAWYCPAAEFWELGWPNDVCRVSALLLIGDE